MRKDRKTCPDCAEMVRAEAKVCRFCGYRFSVEEMQNAADHAHRDKQVRSVRRRRIVLGTWLMVAAMVSITAVIGVAAEQDWIVSWKAPQTPSWSGFWWGTVSESSEIRSVFLSIDKTPPIKYEGHTFVDYECSGGIVIEEATLVDCSLVHCVDCLPSSELLRMSDGREQVAVIEARLVGWGPWRRIRGEMTYQGGENPARAVGVILK